MPLSYTRECLTSAFCHAFTPLQPPGQFLARLVDQQSHQRQHMAALRTNRPDHFLLRAQRVEEPDERGIYLFVIPDLIRDPWPSGPLGPRLKFGVTIGGKFRLPLHDHFRRGH